MIRHSLSKIKTFEQCAFKYKCRYVDNLPTTQGAAAARGTAKHALIEAYIENPIAALPIELSHYTGLLNNIRAAGGRPEVTINLTREWKPAGTDDHIYYKAIIDALVVRLPEAVHYDWKTGKEYDDHYDQKEIYSVAVFSEYPEVSTVRALHVYLDSGRNTERVYSRDQMPAMRDRWVKRFTRLEETTEFHPNPNFGCRYCDFSKAKGGPCKF